MGSLETPDRNPELSGMVGQRRLPQLSKTYLFHGQKAREEWKELES